MSDIQRFRPGVVRSLPILIFTATGVLPFVVGSTWLLKIAGVATIAMGFGYLALLLTTSVEFDGRGVEISTLWRRRQRFEPPELQLRFFETSVVSGSTTKLVQVRDGPRRTSFSLSMFGAEDRRDISRLLQEMQPGPGPTSSGESRA